LKKLNMAKAIALISGVIFIALTLVAIFAVWQIGIPLAKKVQTAASVDQKQALFSDIDKIIQQVAREGPGSKRTIYFTLDRGTIGLNSSTDSIFWETETDAVIMSPRIALDIGNIRIGNMLSVAVYEENFTNKPAWVLENSHLKVWIAAIGNSSSPQPINTSELILALYQKDTDKLYNISNLATITIDDQPTSSSGIGWTEIERNGTDLPYGLVIAVINSTYMPYTINFRLEAGADFLTIEGKI
jgi:hypothetical protein